MSPFQVNPTVVEKLEAAGMSFVGRDTEGKRMEIMELQGIVCTLLDYIVLDNISAVKLKHGKPF
jgi:hypothetical protein